MPSIKSPWIKPEYGPWEFFAITGIRKIYKPGVIIYQEGDEGGSIFYLKKGKVKVGIIFASGTEKILSIQEAPAIFGEAASFDESPRFCSATTITMCEVYSVSSCELKKEIRRNPELALSLFQTMARKMRILTLQVEDMSCFSVLQRIAHILLELSQDYGIHAENGIEISLPITHEELAFIVSATRPTVTSILNQLARNGIIAKKNRYIIIRDLDTLKEIIDG